MEVEEKIKKFNNAINAFYSSRLIIVEGVISAFLETVATTPDFFAIIKDSNLSTNYSAEFAKALTQDGFECRFKLPSNRRHIIALVSGLLFEFDRKSLSIIEFVTKFYPSDSSHGSYLAFLDAIITPYAEAFKYYLVGEPTLTAEALNNDISVIPFPDKAKEDADFWLRALLDIVLGDNSTDENLRREYRTMVNGLLHVLDTRNPMLINVVWIGLKNTFGYYKPAIRELKEIETVLKNFGVID